MKLDFLKLRIACARKCWSVAEAFKNANVSAPTEQRVRKGLALSTKTVGKLSAALGVDVTELLAEQ